MKRILVVVENYNEMIFCETTLKKVGFDTQGMQRLAGLDDLLMTFRPEGVLISESFKTTEAAQILTTIKSVVPGIKGIVINDTGQGNNYGGKVDGFISRPVAATELVKTVAGILGLDAAKILKKLEDLNLNESISTSDTSNKIKEHENEPKPTIGKSDDEKLTHFAKGIFGDDDEDDKVYVQGKIKKADSDKTLVQNINLQTKEQSEDRNSRFAKALKNTPLPGVTMVPKKAVADNVKALRARGKDAEIISIDNERKAFVNALYKKK